MKYKPWSDNDLERLKELYAANISYAEIALELGRTHKATANAIQRYIIHGETLREEKQKRRREHYIGCNHDCFRCPYSDCIAPPSIAAVGISSKDYLE